MCDDHEDQFEQAASGASKTFPKQCSALRKNEHVVIKGRPCKIVEMSTSKTGKHGHAKVHIVAFDVFTGKKMEDICPSTHNMECPFVSRTDYQVLSSDDGFLQLMDDMGSMREDLRVPGQDTDIGKEIKTKLDNSETFLVTVLKAMDEETVVATKAERGGDGK